ncbi:MAG: DUF4339 domain-containing protein [Solobacterium sp.]|nr:DUF4339 domain-containing protein [Solobacterium sp.]MBQ9048979.1 DUF4339 domain-containing protein [Solobacterium sp.]
MEQTWYYTKGDGQQNGPYTDEELEKLIRQGIILADDYIWTDGLDEWLLVGNTIYSIYLPKE